MKIQKLKLDANLIDLDYNAVTPKDVLKPRINIVLEATADSEFLEKLLLFLKTVPGVNIDV